MFQVLLRGEPNVHYLFLTRFVYIFILPLMLFDGIFLLSFFAFFLLCFRGQNKFLQFVLRAYSFRVIMQQIHLDPLSIEKKPSLIF